ncbi:AI-2E family transporter [Halospeciosus flavus]|uniref:AI-2E family transporter n=1 Tax=Halospeciosus flavus TaxID=3032283 RepID=A0ABD5Z8Z4_9EURY|nr:AI-2E family transporter [Halospeciosus flavus]
MSASSPWELDRARVGWWAMAAVLAAALVYIVYSFVGTFVFGIFIYYATRPVYRRLKKRIRPASLAAAVSIFTLALPALLLVAYTIAIALQELNRVIERRGLDLGQFEPYLGPYITLAENIQDPQALLAEPNTMQAIGELVRSVSQYAGFVGSAALHLFVMLTIGFYLLRDDHRLHAWFRRRFSDEDGVVEAYTRAVDHDFRLIFFGNILNAAMTALIGAVVYSALDYVAPVAPGIPYPTLFGLLTGVASLVPVVGMKLVYFPLAGYLGYLSVTGPGPETLWFPLLFFAISFVVVDVIPDLVLRPYVSGRSLHLGMVMLAYIFGPLVWGWYGIFLGPMLLVFLVHFVRLVLPELLAGEPIEPEAVGDFVTTGSPNPDPEDVSGGSPADPESEPDDAADEDT